MYPGFQPLPIGQPRLQGEKYSGGGQTTMRLETIYLVHHSHTDIGYTHDQPIVWELHHRFLDTVLDVCERDTDPESDHAMRWTVETTAPLLHWLRHAPERQIERFLRLEREGRIEVTAMFANLTPLVDTDQLVETLQPLHHLRKDFGLRVRYAMNCDVNGHNWTLVEALLDAGIEGFSMAINEHFGGAPLSRPNVFWWEGPSGRRLLAYNGFPYMMANWLAIGTDQAAFRHQWLPRLHRHLEHVGWNLPVLMLQVTHPFGDNGSVWEALRTFVRRWNAEEGEPRLRLATPREWWAAVRPFADSLPVYRGDWTDYWNFGCISSARETAMNRISRERLRNADQVFAFLTGLGITRSREASTVSVVRAARALRGEAWYALDMWDEHTWGADISVRSPESEDTWAQWHHKAYYAYRARSVGLLLQRDSVAELARRVSRGPDDVLLLYNSLPWTRTVAMAVPESVMQPRGTPDDYTSSRHSQDRDGVRQRRWWLPPTEIPATGYCVVPRAALVEQSEEDLPSDDSEVVETWWCRLVFNREVGGIASWWDRRLERELVDMESEWPFGTVVYERVANTQHPWPRQLLCETHFRAFEHRRGWKPDWEAERWASRRCLSHRVVHTPIGVEITQVLDVPGLHSPVSIRYRLPRHMPCLEVEAEWTMGLSTHPEATYLVLPFALSRATAHLDIGGCAMRPEDEQLPGCCRDYFTVQRWVDLSNEEFGVTVACPRNPMVQLGGLHFAHNRARFTLERGWFFGWVTNNYWETNFRAHQPGQVRAAYWLLPHAGKFDETRAHRFGAEAGTPIVLQSLVESPALDVVLPRSGTLLSLPEPPVLVLHVASDWLYGREDTGDLLVRLFNASDEPQQAEIGPGILSLEAAWQCDLFGAPEKTLPVMAGRVRMLLPPRRLGVVRLRTSTVPGNVPPQPTRLGGCGGAYLM